MAEEFQSSGNWWDATRSRYEAGISPSSSAITTFVDHPDSGAGAGDPNLHIMGLGLDWNQPLFRGGGEKAAESSFRSMLQPDNMNLNMQETGQHHQHQQQQIQWMRSEKLYSGESPATEFKPINRGFSLDHHNQPPPQFSPSHYSTGDSTITSFPLDTAAAAAALYGNSTTLLQGLLAGGGSEQQQVSGAGMNFPYNTHFGMNSSELMAAASWSNSKVPPFLRNSPPKGAAPTPPQSQLQFSNNTAFWNASDMKDARASYIPASYNAAALASDKSKSRSEGGKKSGNDQNQQQTGGGGGGAVKRPRNETAPGLPAFKVRKEKMGDRITALQQLVSPFGKTDTASVLSEAIEYIKFLHEQVSVLSTPYLKSGGGAVVQQQQQQKWCEKRKEGEGKEEDLRSRGLCLVPVSSTFPVTHETTVDFWTPSFGGTFR
ncbi:Transcription factor basic helix-loop-helix 123, partial [Cucurbita argyrosperma subsp. sororia]